MNKHTVVEALEIILTRPDLLTVDEIKKLAEALEIEINKRKNESN